MRIEEVLESLRFHVWIFLVIKIVRDMGLSVGTVVLVESFVIASAHRILDSVAAKVVRMHLQSKPCIKIGRIFRETALHFRVQVIERALSLQLRLEPVCVLDGLSDFMDVLLVTEDCKC